MSVAANVIGNLNLTAAFTQTQSSGVIGSTSGGGSQTYQPLISLADQFTNGTGAGKTCDQLFAKQISLVASTPQTFHFGNGSVNDPSGAPLNMARIRLGILQVVTTTSGYDVKLESSATSGITWLSPSTSPQFARANFGLLIWSYDPNSSGAGVGNVISSTTDGITLDPGSNAVVVNLLVVGDSVA